MSKDLIRNRKERCAEKIKAEHPEFLDKGGEVNHWRIMDKPNRDLQIIVLEYLVWDDLEEEYYWRSFKHLKSLFDRGEGQVFSELDLREITRIMIQQIKKGKKVAGGVPLYHDVWSFMANKESPLEKYVTDEQKRGVVNDGFWDILRRTSPQISNPGTQHSAIEKLSRIIEYEDFFTFFDFKEGVEKATMMPVDLDLDRFNEWDLYMRWYLVQEVEVYRRYGQERGDDVSGRLVAPLVHSLLVGWGGNYEEEREMKKLANWFIRGSIIRSKAIQNVLGKVFERELETSFRGWSYEDWSPQNLNLCERALVDVDSRATKVWEEIKDRVRLEEVPKEIKKYVPGEAYAEYVADLKEQIGKIRRLDISLFGKWMRLRIGIDVPKSTHGRVRNQGLETYFSQRQRPSGDDLVSLARYGPSFLGNRGNRTEGFLFADLLSRGRWPKANAIFMSYDDATGKQRKEFQNAIMNYVEMHGKIRIDCGGLHPRACYPAYNKLPKLVERNPEIFEISS